MSKTKESNQGNLNDLRMKPHTQKNNNNPRHERNVVSKLFQVKAGLPEGVQNYLQVPGPTPPPSL